MQAGPVLTAGGLLLDGRKDFVENAPAASAAADTHGDGVVNEVSVSAIDFMEFYLLNYFKPGAGNQSDDALLGRAASSAVGCTSCHTANLKINHDRRIADLETV